MTLQARGACSLGNLDDSISNTQLHVNFLISFSLSLYNASIILSFVSLITIWMCEFLITNFERIFVQ